MFRLLATSRLSGASVVGSAALILDHSAEPNGKSLRGEHPYPVRSPFLLLADSSVGKCSTNAHSGG